MNRQPLPGRAVNARFSWRSPQLFGLVVLCVGALPLLLAPWRAAALEVDGRGEFAYFQAALASIISVCVLGVRGAAWKHQLVGSARYKIKLRWLAIPSLMTAVVVGFLAVYPALDRPQIISISLVLVVVISPLYNVIQIELVDAQHAGDYKSVAALTAGPAIADLVSSIPLLCLNIYTIQTAVVGALFVEAVRIGLAVTRRAMRRPTSIAPKRRVLSAQFLTDVRRLGPVEIVLTLSVNVDVLILGASGSSSDIGIYAVAKLGMTLVILGSVIAEGRYLVATGARDKLAAMISLPLLVVVVTAVSWVVVTLTFPESFHAAVPLIPILCVSGAAYCALRWLMLAMGRQNVLLTNVLSFGILILLALGLLVARGAVSMGSSAYALTYLGLLVIAVVSASVLAAFMPKESCGKPLELEGV